MLSVSTLNRALTNNVCEKFEELYVMTYDVEK
jgi:hypothetical protein